MRIKPSLLIILFLTLPNIAWKSDTSTSDKLSFTAYAENFYSNLNNSELQFDAFKYGLKGFLALKDAQQLKNTKYLTIIDFSKHSKKERLFIIDTETQQIVHKSLVAHGKNSGIEFATKFSNKPNSYQSSLGFYKTAETYSGKHGFSLRLDGLEFSNSNARKRAVVIHAADYAEPTFVKNNGRLGRSFGCPSLPSKGYEDVITKIKNGTCLFIYHPTKNYLTKSKLINSSATNI